MEQQYQEKEMARTQDEPTIKNWETENMKKSILFVDFFYLYKRQINFRDLFSKIELDYDDVRIFSKIPFDNISESSVDIWRAIRSAVKSGLFVTLFPADADPIITVEIMKSIGRKDVEKITLLSADQGFYEPLRIARRFGKDVTVILSNEFNCWLLRRIANRTINLEDYLTNNENSLISVEAQNEKTSGMEV